MSQTNSGGRPLILAVDDVSVNLVLIKRTLEREYEVLTAGSGEEALRLATSGRVPDLILLDIMMPVMDGYEVLARLRQNPATKDIPVIFVTAMTEDEDECHGLNLGASDYITKPVNAPILLARVQSHLDLKRAQDLLRDQKDVLETEVQARTRSLTEALAQQKELNRRLEDAHQHLVQSEKMAALGQLAAGVAHEINNPVGFVRSNLGSLGRYVGDLLEIIRAGESAPLLPVESPEYLQYQKLKQEKDYEFLRDDLDSLVHESMDGLERVRRIVLDLKDFSREGGQEWAWVDVPGCLDPTLNIVWHELKQKCKVVKEYDPELPKIHCLPSQLNQVFMNLLVNAAQAIEEHGVITLRTRRIGDDGICVDIEDSGCGISADVLARIFDPFFTTKPVGKGTGLGLSISWGIVAKHHGRIEVQSTPGKGTCFSIFLPVDPETTSFERAQPAA